MLVFGYYNWNNKFRKCLLLWLVLPAMKSIDSYLNMPSEAVGEQGEKTYDDKKTLRLLLFSL